jgi:hypothetical protein
MTADFTPESRASLVARWSRLANDIEGEARLQRVLAERLAMLVRARRNKLERVGPLEAGVFSLELMALAELVEVLDAMTARTMVGVARVTVEIADVYLEADRQVLARGGAS